MVSNLRVLVLGSEPRHWTKYAMPAITVKFFGFPTALFPLYEAYKTRTVLYTYNYSSRRKTAEMSLYNVWIRTLSGRTDVRPVIIVFGKALLYLHSVVLLCVFIRTRSLLLRLFRRHQAFSCHHLMWLT